MKEEALEAHSDARSGGGFGARFCSPLFLSASLNPINSSIVATALVPISRALHISVGRTALLVTALYVASAVAQPAMGRFGQTFGPRRIMLLGAGLVVAGGAVGAVGENLATLVVARVLLGVGTAAGFPTAMLMIRRQALISSRSPAGALGGLVISSQLTVLFGLPLGGLLVTVAGWRATFWINIPLALLVLATAWKWAPRDQPRPTWLGVPSVVRDLDLVAMAMFAALLTSVVGLLVSLPEVSEPFLVLAGAAGLLLLWWELRARNPFINVHTLLANLPLTGTYMRTSGMMLVAYSVMYGLTQWLQETRGLSATVTGLLIIPMSAAGAIITRPVSRRGLVKVPLLASAFIALVAGGALRLVDEQTPLWLIVGVTTLVGVALGLGTFGNQSAVFTQAEPEEVGTAAGLLRTSGYVGAIASGSIIGIVFRDGATDAGLHAVADVLIPVSGLVLLLTAFSRALPATLVPRTA
jgi:MFS family permease